MNNNKTIFLSRHGESEYNLKGKLGGNSGLSKKGKLYSIKLFNFFKNIKKDNINVFTSELKRTKETSNYFTKKVSNLKFNEINAGIYEHYTYEEIKINDINEYNKRKLNKYSYRYPEGESYKDLEVRVVTEFKKIMKDNDEFLLIAHNAVIRVILGYIYNIDKNKIPYLEIPLHVLTKIEIKDNDLKKSVVSILSN